MTLGRFSVFSESEKGCQTTALLKCSSYTCMMPLPCTALYRVPRSIPDAGRSERYIVVDPFGILLVHAYAAMRERLSERLPRDLAVAAPPEHLRMKSVAAEEEGGVVAERIVVKNVDRPFCTDRVDTQRRPGLQQAGRNDISVFEFPLILGSLKDIDMLGMQADPDQIFSRAGIAFPVDIILSDLFGVGLLAVVKDLRQPEM